MDLVGRSPSFIYPFPFEFTSALALKTVKICSRNKTKPKTVNPSLMGMLVYTTMTRTLMALVVNGTLIFSVRARRFPKHNVNAAGHPFKAFHIILGMYIPTEWSLAVSSLQVQLQLLISYTTNCKTTELLSCTTRRASLILHYYSCYTIKYKNSPMFLYLSEIHSS